MSHLPWRASGWGDAHDAALHVGLADRVRLSGEAAIGLQESPGSVPGVHRECTELAWSSYGHGQQSHAKTSCRKKMVRALAEMDRYLTHSCIESWVGKAALLNIVKGIRKLRNRNTRSLAPRQVSGIAQQLQRRSAAQKGSKRVDSEPEADSMRSSPKRLGADPASAGKVSDNTPQLRLLHQLASPRFCHGRRWVGSRMRP